MKMLMMMVAIVMLAGCEKAHTVEDYYNDDALAAKTLEACRANGEAERRVLAKKPACQNVWAAEKRRWDAAASESEAYWNDWMKEHSDRTRLRAREAAAVTAAGG